MPGSGGCLVPGGVPAPKGVPGPRKRCLVPGRWVPGPGGCLVLGGGPGGDPPRTATAAGGMHPTGMHSCSK